MDIRTLLALRPDTQSNYQVITDFLTELTEFVREHPDEAIDMFLADLTPEIREALEYDEHMMDFENCINIAIKNTSYIKDETQKMLEVNRAFVDRLMFGTVPTGFGRTLRNWIFRDAQTVANAIVNGLKIVLTNHVDMPCNDGSKDTCYFPSSIVTEDFWRIFFNVDEIKKSHLAAAAYMAICGFQAHEAMHALHDNFTLRQFVEFADEELRNSAYYNNQVLMVIANCVLDIFNENLMKAQYPTIRPYTENYDRMLIPTWVVDRFLLTSQIKVKIYGGITPDMVVSAISLLKNDELFHYKPLLDMFGRYIKIAKEANDYGIDVIQKANITWRIFNEMLQDDNMNLTPKSKDCDNDTQDGDKSKQKGNGNSQNNNVQPESDNKAPSGGMIDGFSGDVIGKMIKEAVEQIHDNMTTNEAYDLSDIVNRLNHSLETGEIQKTAEEEKKGSKKSNNINPDALQNMLTSIAHHDNDDFSSMINAQPHQSIIIKAVPVSDLSNAYDAKELRRLPNVSDEWSDFASYLQYIKARRHGLGPPALQGLIHGAYIPNLITNGKIFDERLALMKKKIKPRIVVLVDASGSTQGTLHRTELAVARKAYQSAASANFPISVYSHCTGGYSYHEQTSDIYCIAAYGMPVAAGDDMFSIHYDDIEIAEANFGKAIELSYGANADAHVIAHLAEYAFPTQRSDNQNINAIIVLSDGRPSVTPKGGGHGGIEYTKEIVEKVRFEFGIRVFSFSLVKDVMSANDKIYGSHNIAAYESVEETMMAFMSHIYLGA